MTDSDIRLRSNCAWGSPGLDPALVGIENRGRSHRRPTRRQNADDRTAGTGGRLPRSRKRWTRAGRSSLLRLLRERDRYSFFASRGERIRSPADRAGDECDHDEERTEGGDLGDVAQGMSGDGVLILASLITVRPLYVPYMFESERVAPDQDRIRGPRTFYSRRGVSIGEFPPEQLV